MRIFYTLSFPFMWFLNKVSDLLLKSVGLYADPDTHDSPYSEAELRALFDGARARGELTSSKHRLLDSIFNMDSRLARQIMVPRPDVVFFRLDQTMSDCIEIARRTKHTRFPLCKNSLDDVVGVIHIKDLLGLPPTEPPDLKAMARSARFVPETLPASSLLKQFQATKQHLAFVLDEHGAVQGMVTLENVLEELIGSVQDEFDEEEPHIVPDGPHHYLVSGATPLEEINDKLKISLEAHRVDTLSGLLFKRAGRVLRTGDRIDLGPVWAEVMEMRSSRAWKIRLSRRQVGEKDPLNNETEREGPDPQP
jgi:CBS domain containing-hemolysin-like protein